MNWKVWQRKRTVSSALFALPEGAIPVLVVYSNGTSWGYKAANIVAKPELANICAIIANECDATQGAAKA